MKKPWYKDRKLIVPMIFTLIVGLCISYYFSTKTDKILEEIKDITIKTYDVLTGNGGQATRELEPLPPIKKKIIKTSITPDGTIIFWATLNKPNDVYQKGYIFDIGDSLIKK